MKHVKPYKLFESKKTIEPSKESRTMSFWHGGNLDDMHDESLSHKKGHWEYGPGLYMTTSYNVVQKYAKGSRKLYMVTVEKGTDLGDAKLPMDKITEFLNSVLSKAKVKDFLKRVSDIKDRLKQGPEEPLDAEYVLNILINENTLPSTKSGELRKFFVRNGIDYHLVNNAFGWGETMMVLYNTRKIKNIERVMSGDEITEFDLPTKMNESKNVDLFHVSNCLNRESIKKHGLNSSGPTPWPEDMYPKGTYLFDDIKKSRQYGFGNGDPFDIWKINAANYTVEQDPITKGAFLIKQDIFPKDIDLIETHEKDVTNPS